MWRETGHSRGREAGREGGKEGGGEREGGMEEGREGELARRECSAGSMGVQLGVQCWEHGGSGGGSVLGAWGFRVRGLG